MSRKEEFLKQEPRQSIEAVQSLPHTPSQINLHRVESHESLPPKKTKSAPTLSPKKPEEEEDSEPKSLQEKAVAAAGAAAGTVAAVAGAAAGKVAAVAETARQAVVWSVTDIFDWNPKYLLQLRGFMNVLHLILSLVIVILLSITCRNHFPSSGIEGFFCQPAQTFLLIVSCGSLFTSLLFLVCCLFSKRTETLLFQTAFEISYFVLYFVLLMTASAALMISNTNYETGIREIEEENDDRESTRAAAIIGLLNSAFYGVCAVVFFLSHRYYASSKQSLNSQ